MRTHGRTRAPARPPQATSRGPESLSTWSCPQQRPGSTSGGGQGRRPGPGRRAHLHPRTRPTGLAGQTDCPGGPDTHLSCPVGASEHRRHGGGPQEGAVPRPADHPAPRSSLSAPRAETPAGRRRGAVRAEGSPPQGCPRGPEPLDGGRHTAAWAAVTRPPRTDTPRPVLAASLLPQKGKHILRGSHSQQDP